LAPTPCSIARRLRIDLGIERANHPRIYLKPVAMAQLDPIAAALKDEEQPPVVYGAQGRGPDEPAADNSSVEGRA
jgi:hypothetical protein